MKLLIGIDGGQTSTKAVVMDDSGRLLGAGRGGPANHIREPGGIERIRQSLRDAISEARNSAGIGDSSVVCAYLGMTGGSAQMEELCRPVVLGMGVERMELGHDSLIALYSVTFGKPGVVVIGGTGSVGFGRDARGHSARTGGWGYIFGDEGSGYWIAVRALNASARASDGIDPQTNLLDYLCRALKVSTLAEIHALVYSAAHSRPDVAAFASAVCEAAVGGDSVAQRILEDAGEELGRLAVGVLKSLGFDNEPVTVGMAGGVFTAGQLVIDSFTRTVRAEAPLADVTLPLTPPAVGAALLALESVGGVVDSAVIDNIQATLGNVGKMMFVEMKS